MYPLAEIKSRTVTDFNYHVNPFAGGIKLNVAVNVGYGTPKSEESRTGLIHVIISLKAADPEDYSILFVENTEVTFNTRPEDFEIALNEFFEREGFRLASDDLDKALEGIGRPPMKIKDSQ